MKEAYYFPHFSVARNDRKIQRLRMQLGVEGYGIYFMLLETLREQTDFSYPLSDIDLLSKEFDTSTQKVEAVIKSYGLFQFDENCFYSEKFIEFLSPYLERKKRAKDAAEKRWDKQRLLESNANAMQMHTNGQSDGNATVIQKKRKETLKEIKETKPEIKIEREFFQKDSNDSKFYPMQAVNVNLIINGIVESNKSDEFKAWFNLWLWHLANNGKKLNMYSQQLLYRDVKSDSYEKLRGKIENSIKNNWLTLIEPKREAKETTYTNLDANLPDDIDEYA